MCLCSKSKYPVIAKEDIECYKVYLFSKATYSSPYQKTRMPSLNELATTELDYDTYFIEKGFHSFVNLNDANNEAKELEISYSRITSTNTKNYADYYEFQVFKCIIPKGTQYYLGYYGSVKSYCSESIIVKEYLDKDNLI